MLNTDISELKDALKPILGLIDSIEPIGNHHLNRYLVYKLSCGVKNM